MTERTRLPSSLYRLQLNREMPLERVRGLLPYLAALGVDGLYLSPLLAARRGSRHGYDGVDPPRLWPDLGSESDWHALVEAAHRRGLGLVADIVPNHLAACDENGAWWEVLRLGPDAPTAAWFDIDWQPHPVTGRPCLVLAVLPSPGPEALRNGELALVREGPDLVFRLRGGGRFPLAPETEAEARSILDQADPPERPDTDRRLALLDRQHYRLIPSSEAHRGVNYRRFFQVNELVGLRVEEPTVFYAVHHRILDWIAHGDLAGVRVDHIDGLIEPRRYLERLRAEIRTRCPGPFGIWVEQILLGDEPLRPTWPIDGSTGYDALARLTRLFVDPEVWPDLERTYRDQVPGAEPPEAIVAAAKREAIREFFAADVDRWLRSLRRQPPGGRSLPPDDTLRAQIVEFVADLDVYRSYVEPTGPIDPEDRAIWGRAIDRAGRYGPAELLQSWWEAWSDPAAVSREPLLRLQQFTPAVMAKGVEDRALYRDLGLTALNEVGIPPGPVDRDPVGAFHRATSARVERWPNSIVTTSTHDTKRSEDVRARLLALAQEPRVWDRLARLWRQAIGRVPGVRELPDRSEGALYLLFQAVVGTWPLDGIPSPEYRARLRAYGEKALREAGIVTGWSSPVPLGEQAILDRVDAVVQYDVPFRQGLAESRGIWGFGGALLSLAQTTLKLTGPGVPDLYQGTELWDDSLVDPDNRRPVDWARRAAELQRLTPWIEAEAPPVAELLHHWTDGRVKLWLTARLLRLRREDPTGWSGGAYRPWTVPFDARPPVVAFLRGGERDGSLVVTARLLPGLLRSPRRDARWEPRDDLGVLRLPGSSTHWIDRLSGRRWTVGDDRAVPLAELLGELPVVVLQPDRPRRDGLSGPGAGASSPPGSSAGSRGTSGRPGR
ncbi:MAG: malto-oligosyltrehalose synthase [Thermoplasmata archaeon]|jgi:(1->4)-alpha-D-glucan 1-alpha-D-glucosylmutase